MSEYTPVVREAHAFLEISKDFTTPAEIFRESIANSLDAYARTLWLRISIRKERGRDTVVIDLSDDGGGMNGDGIRAFLNLSDSIKPKTAPSGKTVRRMTGYKGHGTKVYFNSDKLEVLSYDGASKPVYCCLSDPRGELALEKTPKADIREDLSLEELRRLRTEWGFPELALNHGTSIRVVGYQHNL